MTATTAGSKTYDVAVIGCGLMGAALARNFASEGLNVAAWNRSPERAEALTADGVTAVRSTDEVVRSSALVIACTSTYTTTREALTGATDWTGTALVNIGSGTPTDAGEFQTWAQERGASYLDGAILCYPHQIGSDEGMVLYAGSPDVWEQHEQTLMLTGPHSALVSEHVGGAAVLDAAIVGGFYSAALNAYVEAVTYALDQGVAPDVLGHLSDLTFQNIAATGREALTAISTDDHATDSAYLGVYAEGCRATVAVMQSAGHKARLLAAAVENMNEAEAAGLGGLGFFALTKVARLES